MTPLSEIARSLKGLWLLGTCDRSGLSLFGSSGTRVARSFLAIIWCLPAFIAFAIMEYRPFAAGAPDMQAHISNFIYIKALSADAISLALMSIIVALCVPVLRLPVSPSTLVVLNNWLLVPSNYGAVFFICLARFFERQIILGQGISFIVLVIGATVLLAGYWTIFRTATEAAKWKIAFFVGINASAQYLLLTGLQTAFGVQSTYE